MFGESISVASRLVRIRSRAGLLRSLEGNCALR
jgi:hypothetical protein